MLPFAEERASIRIDADFVHPRPAGRDPQGSPRGCGRFTVAVRCDGASVPG
ncbi:hypothetical protein FM106_29480 [Brachybacterium faecium]|nr:hypothetical protein FM106_29480 [Brachybacterium faecium]